MNYIPINNTAYKMSFYSPREIYNINNSIVQRHIIDHFNIKYNNDINNNINYFDYNVTVICINISAGSSLFDYIVNYLSTLYLGLSSALPPSLVVFVSYVVC